MSTLRISFTIARVAYKQSRVCFSIPNVLLNAQRFESNHPISRKDRKARKTSTDMTSQKSFLASVANDQLSKVVAAVERMKEDNSHFIVIQEKDRVTIDLGPKYGMYVISYESNLGVLQLSSPRSGGFMYVYDEETR